MTISTAIIGMGKMGRIRKNTIESHKSFKLSAICDVDESIKSEFPGIDYYNDWEAIIRTKPDAVFVCTYNNILTDIVCTALRNGINVFCEKPPGKSIADVKSMINAELESGGKVLKYGFNHRFHYAIMEAKAIVSSGRYGRLLWGRGVYGKAGDLKLENSWRSDKQIAGGGILLDQGIHMLDLLTLFFDDFTNVKSYVEKCYWKNKAVEDNAFALLRTESGQVAMLHSSATHWKHKFNLDLFMEDGYICVNGILSSTRSYGDESITFARKQVDDEAKAIGKPREEIIYFDQDDSWQHELEDFYQCIIGKKEVPEGSSSDAYKVMKLIEEVYSAGSL